MCVLISKQGAFSLARAPASTGSEGNQPVAAGAGASPPAGAAPGTVFARGLLLAPPPISVQIPDAEAAEGVGAQRSGVGLGWRGEGGTWGRGGKKGEELTRIVSLAPVPPLNNSI